MSIEARFSELEERDIVELAQRGDIGAFKWIYDSYRDRVYNLAFYWLGDRVLAEDALQIVFMKVHRAMAGFRFESSFSTWIYRITANECQNQARRSGARFVPLEAILGSAEELDPGPLQDYEQARSQRQEIIKQAIMELPEKLRAVIVLKYIEGLSYEEIASVLGCKTGTVASRMNRALARLESQLKPLRKLL
jgi:RNA polymerase sigma-70 factor (ECF subfamily)